MFTKHVIKHLSTYQHGELGASEKLRVESHLRECPACRSACDEIQFGASLASMLSPTNAPQSILREIEAASRTPRLASSMTPALAAALAVTMALTAGLFFQNYVENMPSWEVAVRGTARIGNMRLQDAGRLRAGEELQTDGSSEARVKIANIGELTVDPNTKIRLLVTKSDQHRVALERGKIEARTWAPPRLFVVETPSATAIDLGCMYTLNVEDDGSSLLHVTLGLVALERRGRETIVPAGAFCRTRTGKGPGTPYFEDASSQFQSALDYLDFGQQGAERTRQLQILLRESRLRDGLTLWFLIPRLDPQSRGPIYDRLAQFIPPPEGVTRNGITALDPKMLEAWQALVAQLWQ